jgi:hypothetical protein
MAGRAGAAVAVAIAVVVAVYSVDLGRRYIGEWGSGCGTPRIAIMGALITEIPLLLVPAFGGWIIAGWARFGVRVARTTVIAAIAGWIVVMLVSGVIP